MKLTPTMFDDPEPSEMVSMKTPRGMSSKENPEVLEWKRRRAKPEFKGWKSFEEEMPRIKTKIYVIYRSDLDESNHPHKLINVGEFDNWVRTNEDVSYEDENWIWTYASSYDEEFEHYESNRLRWKGFESKRTSTGVVVSTVHDDGELEITFHLDGQVDISNYDFEGNETLALFFIEGISLELFELICKEYGIKLEEI